MIFVGIDIAAASFVATAIRTPEDRLFFGLEFLNEVVGFQSFLATLQNHTITPQDSLVVMEATGVYTEGISHFLYKQGYPVHIEPPKKVRQAFSARQKTDPVDSAQIAEYGFRFQDKLHLWEPRDLIIDNLAALLTVRELLTKASTANKNARKSLQRKKYTHETLIAIHTDIIKTIKAKIKQIDKEMLELLKGNHLLNQQIYNVMTIPGVGLLLAANLAVITGGFQHHINHKQIASYIGIAPFEYESGTSVKRPPKSDKAGSKRIRKLLRLASMSLCEHNAEMKRFYLRNIQAGKEKKVVISKISHKLLAIICTIIQENRPYLKNYQSVNPQLFEKP